MLSKTFCKSCSQKNECEKIYQEIGNFKGPSVTFKVISAFLIPLLIFIITLIISDKIVRKVISSEELRTFVAFSAAISLTFLFLIRYKKYINKAVRILSKLTEADDNET